MRELEVVSLSLPVDLEDDLACPLFVARHRRDPDAECISIGCTGTNRTGFTSCEHNDMRYLQCLLNVIKHYE